MPETLNNIVELNNITKSFLGVKALEDVTLHIREGEIHALVGKNGAGKSTLVKILSGIYSKDTGSIVIENKKVNISSPHELSLLGIYFVYQEANLIPFFNAAENLFLGKEPTAIIQGFTSKKRMEEKAKIIFEKLDEDKIDIYKPVRLLTSAERQILTIARVLLSENVKLIVFDEPTSSLSYKEVDRLYKFIENLKKTGISILYISHRLEEIFRLADRVTVIRDGKKIGTYNVVDLNQDELAEKITGGVSLYISRNHQNNNELAKKEENIEMPILKLENISVGNKVKNVSFEIYKSEVVALIGLVGSGKTELAEALFGYRKIDTGTVFVNGERVSIRSPEESLKKGINLIPDDRANKGLVLPLTIRENITVSCLSKISKFNIINSRKEKKLVDEIIKNLSIKCSSQNQLVRFLSGGNQQKVIVGGKIQIKSNLFIFDEICNGIDIGTKVYLCNMIRKFATEQGISSIYITNDITEAMSVADRVLIMQNGTITKAFLCRDINEDILLQNIIVSN